MEENRASVTSIVTAFSRAYHSMYDNPKIFDDFLAEKLFTREELGYFERNLAESLKFIDPELASSCQDQATALKYVMRHNSPATLSRSRYTEDILENAVNQGISQYVILGAGMDTFAYRRPNIAGKIKVFELDHPATQSYKTGKIKNLGWDIPSQLHYIPVDFTKTSLAEALSSSEYNQHEPSFFSWLGVTMYLSIEVILDTFRAVAKISPSGSILVFDYIDSDAFLPGKASEKSKKTQEIVRRAGEPMKTGFKPSNLSIELEKTGLDLKETLSPNEIEEHYFKNRSDGYHAADHMNFTWAVVK